jgi:DNA-binding CsgD family transcriptional regulator
MIRLPEAVEEVRAPEPVPLTGVIAAGNGHDAGRPLVAVGPGAPVDEAGELVGSLSRGGGGGGGETEDDAGALGVSRAGADRDPETGRSLVTAASAALPNTRSPLVRGLVGEMAPAASDTFGLSRREREVLTLIADGRTNREIGERLFISQKTVGVHVGNILAKLGVSGRVEAAAVAIRLGLTDTGPARTATGR